MDDTMNVEDGDVAEKCSFYGMELDDGIPIDSSELLHDVFVADVAAPASSTQIGASSYGKSNFLLPVTFFDIPSNLTLLNECCPLTIKVVDCDKHPCFYKKYAKSDLQSPVAEIDSANKDMNNFKDNDCVHIDLTENIYDKFEKVDYTNQSGSNFIENKIHRKKRSDKTVEKHKLLQDKMKDIALSQIDLSHVDFKRNIGLIGLKIQRRNSSIELDNIVEYSTEVNNVPVMDDLNEQTRNKDLNTREVLEVDKATFITSVPKRVEELVDSNIGPVYSSPVKDKPKELTKNKPKEKIDTKEKGKNKLNNYISVVDEALCNVGTDLIPVNSVEDVNNMSSESKIKNGHLTKLSDTIVQISKSKLSKRSINKIDPMKNCKMIISKDTHPVVKVDEKETKHKLSSKTRTNERSHKQKSAKKNVSKVLNAVKKNTYQERNKEIDEVKETVMSRSKSPVLSCQPSTTNNNRPHQTHIIQHKDHAELRLDNSDSNNHRCPSSSNENQTIENCSIDVNISAPQNKLKNPGECETTNDKNVFAITAVSIDKLRNNIYKPDVNERNNNVFKFRHEYTPVQDLRGEQDNIGVINDDVNKNVIPVRNEMLSNTDNIVNKVKQTSNVTAIGSLSCSQQMPIQHSQRDFIYNSNTQIRPNHFKNRHQVRPQIRHNLPINSHLYDRPNIRRIPPLIQEPVFGGNIRPNYTMKNIFPRLFSPYPRQNHPQYGSNPYWPYRYPPHRLPPPPPPPPPPEKCDGSLQNIVQKSDVAHGKNIKNVVKKVNIISHCLPKNLVILTDGNTRASDQVKNNRNVNSNGSSNFELPEQNIQINKDVSKMASKPVDSKTEMFLELQKEMMTVNSEVSGDHSIDNAPNQSRFNGNVRNETIRNSQNVCNFSRNEQAAVQQEPNFDKNTLNPTSFASDSKILYGKWNKDKRNRFKKDESLDWKIQISDEDKTTANDKHNIMQNDVTGSNNDKTTLLYPANRTNRPKAGPLCMKNRTGAFARLQAPPRSEPSLNTTEKLQPNKGYSPPILPIPTFQKSLEMLTQVSKAHRNHSIDKTFSNVSKTTIPQHSKTTIPQHEHNTMPTKRKRLQYFCVENEGKSLKKISLQDYQNRVAKGNDKCIVLEKGSKRMKRNQSSEQDLGYDSDTTVKL